MVDCLKALYDMAMTSFLTVINHCIAMSCQRVLDLDCKMMSSSSAIYEMKFDSFQAKKESNGRPVELSLVIIARPVLKTGNRKKKLTNLDL